MAPCKSFPFHSNTWSPAKTQETLNATWYILIFYASAVCFLHCDTVQKIHIIMHLYSILNTTKSTNLISIQTFVCVCLIPGLRCPTVSARLPFLTLVIKAQSLPDSVILPPTTCRSTEVTGLALKYRCKLTLNC